MRAPFDLAATQPGQISIVSSDGTGDAVSYERCRRCAAAQSRGIAAAIEESRESVGLSYVDLLYALPVAALANRLTELDPSNVTAGGWANVAIALTAVTCGWVGHHGNRDRLPQCLKQQEERWFFTTPRFVQFILEILIIAVYFALVLTAGLPHPSDSGQPFELTLTKWLAVGFVLYFFWDLLDIWIAGVPTSRRSRRCQQTEAWSSRAVKGMVVTLAFAGVFGAICAYVWTGHHFTRHDVRFDLILIALLVIYRATQEIRGGGGFAARWEYR